MSGVRVSHLGPTHGRYSFVGVFLPIFSFYSMNAANPLLRRSCIAFPTRESDDAKAGKFVLE